MNVWEIEERAEYGAHRIEKLWDVQSYTDVPTNAAHALNAAQSLLEEIAAAMRRERKRREWKRKSK